VNNSNPLSVFLLWFPNIDNKSPNIIELSVKWGISWWIGLNVISLQPKLYIMMTLFGLAIIGGISWITIFLINDYIIPRLNPDNRFVKLWKSWFVDDDPYL